MVNVSTRTTPVIILMIVGTTLMKQTAVSIGFMVNELIHVKL